MSLKFLANNLIESALIAPSSENAQYPISNLTSPQRTKTFRTTSNSDSIVIDLGTAETCDHFAITDNWKNGFGFTSITLEANGTDEWSSPAFSQVINFDNKFGIGVTPFTPATYRFWRLVVTSSLGYCELSNIFLGSASQITTNGIGYNWAYVNRDLSSVSTNRYGQEFIDDIGTRKEINGVSFQIMNKDEMDVIFDVYDNVRTVKPMFIYLPLENDNLSNNDNRYNGFYRFKGEPTFTNINSGYYNTTIALRECR